MELGSRPRSWNSLVQFRSGSRSRSILMPRGRRPSTRLTREPRETLEQQTAMGPRPRHSRYKDWRFGSTRDRANGAYCQYVRLYRMVKRKGRRPTSGEEMATALDRWDEEGGAQTWRGLYPMKPAICAMWSAESWSLGAALVREWNDLPTNVQRRLFERAASAKAHDAAVLKTQVARFLHDLKALRVGAKFLRSPRMRRSRLQT